MRYFRDNLEPAPSPLSHPLVTGLAEKHGRTPAQVVLRWR